VKLHSSSKARIAVIGAGMAGIGCAKNLKQHGFHPTIFEKSRGPGGRLATRRVGDGITFDHGAQYITAHSAAFQRVMKKAIETGAAEQWCPRSLSRSPSVTDGWIVGTPAMNSLIKPLADGLDIRLTTEVTAIAREGDTWRVRTSTSETGEPFDIVVSSAPAPQARVLFASEPEIAEALAKVSIAPCWALMLTFASPADPGFDVWRSDAEALTWISRNTSKPSRRTAKDCWVVHASPDWSQRYLELDRVRVAEMMIEMLSPAFGGCLPKIDHASAHRWRFARTTAPLSETYLCSEDRTLFVGGDWCLGARVECAFESGQAIAKALTGALED
jgi:predicted NAD/FAD-dependent oxidoreductase